MLLCAPRQVQMCTTHRNRRLRLVIGGWSRLPAWRLQGDPPGDFMPPPTSHLGHRPQPGNEPLPPLQALQMPRPASRGSSPLARGAPPGRAKPWGPSADSAPPLSLPRPRPPRCHWPLGGGSPRAANPVAGRSLRALGRELRRSRWCRYSPAEEPSSEGAMAAASPMESLQEEVTCSLCLDYFKDPVITACGHNFCRACLIRCWEGPGPAIPCPQCRAAVQQRHTRPNRQLANMVSIVQQLSLQAIQGAKGGRVCRAHQEPLKLFCEEDQAPICMVCDRSWVHRVHTVVPLEEAAQKYKGKIQAHLKTLRKEREKLLGWKVIREGRSQEYLKQIQAERQKIVAEFQQLRQFLEEQERLLLAQLEKLDKEIGRLQTDTVRKLSVQISHLSERIGELEGTCQKPASEFLQDVRSTLSRCETGPFQLPEEISPELDERVRGFSQKTTALSETLRQFTGHGSIFHWPEGTRTETKQNSRTARRGHASCPTSPGSCLTTAANFIAQWESSEQTIK
ncbi:zinc finger protein RFP-like isoform X4 [Pelodiscus sinensis]|uniref:zinc finger protein RFP-like isoform X4 n=1 Tax=Pelodiscus sinensis TaxID=13735 RepID=UPI003F6B7FEC